MPKNPYKTAEDLHLDVMAFFEKANKWSVNAKDGLTLEQQVMLRPGAGTGPILPMAWIAWSRFEKWDDFRALTLDTDDVMRTEARWIDNVIQKSLQVFALDPNTKNSRGYELILSTLWGYSVKQTIDAGHNQDVIVAAAMELAKGIPMDDRETYIDTFHATCLLGIGAKR